MRILPKLTVAMLATLAGSGLVACGGEEKAGDKPLTTVKGDHFTVSMPGSPKRQVITGETAYVTEAGSESYAISVLTLSNDTRGDLDGALRGTAARLGATVKKNKPVRFQGFPGRDARFTGKDDKGKNATLFARVIFAKSRLFQLLFIRSGAEVTSPPPQYAAFVSSLKIR